MRDGNRTLLRAFCCRCFWRPCQNSLKITSSVRRDSCPRSSAHTWYLRADRASLGLPPSRLRLLSSLSPLGTLPPKDLTAHPCHQQDNRKHALLSCFSVFWDFPTPSTHVDNILHWTQVMHWALLSLWTQLWSGKEGCSMQTLLLILVQARGTGRCQAPGRLGGCREGVLPDGGDAGTASRARVVVFIVRCSLWFVLLMTVQNRWWEVQSHGCGCLVMKQEGWVWRF